MKNTNIRMPAFLMTIQFISTIVVLCLSMTLLPEKMQTVIRLLPASILESIKIFNSETQSSGLTQLSLYVSFLYESWWIWVWGLFSSLSGVLITWLVQVLISGMQRKWRYIAGFSAFILIWIVITWGFSKVGLPLFGKVSGFLLGDFFGWWATVGYKVIDQRHTDIRTLHESLVEVKEYNPERYFNLKKGIFVGLTSDGKPRYISIADSRMHLQLCGQTRFGKTVSDTILQAQAALLGETVIVIDPKADKYSPSVLKRAAERANVPFIYLDIRPDQAPQLNILSGAAEHEIEELLNSCFDSSDKSSDADVYRAEERAAIRKLARSQCHTLGEMVNYGAKEPAIYNCKKLWPSLQEIASHPVIQTKDGWKLEELIGKPCVIYIVGSSRHDNTIRLQKLILLRILQLIYIHGVKEDANWTSLFLDEFKFLLCTEALRALGTIADRNCHLTLAHQSLGDLSDVEGLDPQAVYGAVVVNTGLKLMYRTKDPKTADWAAAMSGDIQNYTESISKSPAAHTPGSYQENQRPLIERNVFLSLPKMTGILFGNGLAEQLSVYYMPKSETPRVVTVAATQENESDLEQGII